MIITSRVQIFIESRLLESVIEAGLTPKECLEFGMKFKLAELDLIDNYPKNKLLNNISNLQEIIKENEKQNNINT